LQEDRYLQGLDIVCTTEILTWGQGTNHVKADGATNHTKADIEASMPARVLSEAVDEAFESAKLVCSNPSQCKIKIQQGNDMRYCIDIFKIF
jgi:hypothetical protein